MTGRQELDRMRGVRVAFRIVELLRRLWRSGDRATPRFAAVAWPAASALIARCMVAIADASRNTTELSEVGEVSAV